MERSLLFVPGDRLARFDKAVASGAHAVILDLEDAVLPGAKGKARDAVTGWLAGRAGGTVGVAVRINGIGTDWHVADIGILGATEIGAVMLPKAEDAAATAAFIAALPRPMPVIALIETARGLWNADRIAAVPGVARLGFGSVDFQLDCGIDDEGEGLLFARSRIVVASAMAGLPAPLDGVCVAFDDESRLKADTARARRLGFGGKMCIHPRQVAIVNQGFALSERERDWARRVVAAAETAGSMGAVQLDGRMIDAPVVERARNMLDTDR